MVLSIAGWINGLTATGLAIYGCMFGYYLIKEGRKTKAKLLSPMGVGIIFAGFLWLGIVFDFFSVLFTERNIDNSYGLVGILCLMWVPIATIFNIYIICRNLISR